LLDEWQTISNNLTAIGPSKVLKAKSLMTFQEAQEYLNLPANSSEQLVQKRYLELTKDYQKAINNAPSDHFSALYQENLDKIEEAYRLLTALQETDESDSVILQRIQQIQEIVDTFTKEEEKGNLNPEAQDRIQHYIDQISNFQASLQEDESEKGPSKFSKPSEKWDPMVKSSTENQEVHRIPGQESGDQNKEGHTIDHRSDADKEPGPSRGWSWEIKALKNRLTPSQEGVNPDQDKPTRQRSSEDAFIEKWVIEIILNSSFATTSGARKQSYDQLIMAVIMIILILGVIGAIYILFPLL